MIYNIQKQDAFSCTKQSPWWERLMFSPKQRSQRLMEPRTPNKLLPLKVVLVRYSIYRNKKLIKTISYLYFITVKICIDKTVLSASVCVLIQPNRHNQHPRYAALLCQSFLITPLTWNRRRNSKNTNLKYFELIPGKRRSNPRKFTEQIYVQAIFCSNSALVSSLLRIHSLF